MELLGDDRTNDDIVSVSHYANTSSITGEGSLVDDQVLGVEDVIDVDDAWQWLVSDAGDVAGALDDVLVDLGGDDHEPCLRALTAFRKSLEALGLDLVHRDVVDDHDDLAIRSLGGEDGLESQTLDLLVEDVAVGAGLGGKHDAAVRPLRERGCCPDGRGRCPSGATACGRRRKPQHGSERSGCPDGSWPGGSSRLRGQRSCSAQRRRSRRSAPRSPTSAAGHADNFNRRHSLSTPFLISFWRKPSAGCGRKPSAGCC